MNIVKGQPLTLPDGTIILPEADADGRKIISAQEQEEAQSLAEITEELEEALDDPFDNEYAGHARRTLGDITVPFHQQNLLMIVVGYSLWGLDTHAVSRILEVSEDRVIQMQQTDYFIKLRQELIEALRMAEASTVHGYLHDKALMAAKVVAHELKSKSGDNRLVAAKDILDRSGFRPTDRVDHVHRFEDELRIVHLTNSNVLDTEVKLS